MRRVVLAEGLLHNHENEPFAANMEWAEASGRGKIFAFNRHHMAFHPGFKDEIPYVYALIELDEGPLVSSTLVGDRTAEGRLRRRPEGRGRLRGSSGGRLHAAALPDRGLSLSERRPRESGDPLASDSAGRWGPRLRADDIECVAR